MTSAFKPFAAAAITAAAIVVAAPVANSSPDCGAVPKAEWRPLEDAAAAIKARGYEVREAEVDKGCYEIKATGKDGDRIKFYLNPKSMDVVRDNRR